MKVRLGFVSNSSSEAFICNTKKSLERVEEELRELLKVYNMMTDSKDTFEEVFRAPYYGDGKSYVDEYLGYYKDSENLFTDYRLMKSKGTKDKLCINSASDNAIPYALFEIIEDVYDAVRVHLG